MKSKEVSDRSGQQGFVTWSQIGENVNPNNERKEPMTLGPLDLSIPFCSEGTVVQLYWESSVAEHWTNCHHTMGKRHEDKLGGGRGTLHIRDN